MRSLRSVFADELGWYHDRYFRRPYQSLLQSLEYSLNRHAELILDPISPLALGELEEMYADTSKLERELAYSPVWDYEEGIPRFADWFLNNYGKTFKM